MPYAPAVCDPSTERVRLPADRPVTDGPLSSSSPSPGVGRIALSACALGWNTCRAPVAEAENKSAATANAVEPEPLPWRSIPAPTLPSGQSDTDGKGHEPEKQGNSEDGHHRDLEPHGPPGIDGSSHIAPMAAGQGRHRMTGMGPSDQSEHLNACALNVGTATPMEETTVLRPSTDAGNGQRRPAQTTRAEDGMMLGAGRWPARTATTSPARPAAKTREAEPSADCRASTWLRSSISRV